MFDFMTDAVALFDVVTLIIIGLLGDDLSAVQDDDPVRRTAHAEVTLNGPTEKCVLSNVRVDDIVSVDVGAYIGGFHLFRSSDEDVRGLASRIKDAGITELYTGHCTGERAFRILREELGQTVRQFHCGMVMEL